MINFKDVTIFNTIVHLVGNRIKEEEIYLSENEIILEEEVNNHFKGLIGKTFKNFDQSFHFTHSSNLKLNEIYNFADSIFEGEDFVHVSQNIANHLYAQTRHHSIKAGEIFILQLSDVLYKNAYCKALAIFKSESKDEYFKIDSSKNNEITLLIDHGISLGKMDKAALIINLDYSEGFNVFSFENAGADTQYWREDFLSIDITDNELSKTSALIELCKNYSTEYINQAYGKQDQVNFVRRSLDYIEKESKFDFKNFEEAVIGSVEDVKVFRQFKNEYFLPEENFIDVSKEVASYQKKKIKKEIKLDRNFVIKIDTTDSEQIERGYDARRKMHFYKLFFNNEI